MVAPDVERGQVGAGRRALNLLGLAARAGRIAPGTARAREAARAACAEYTLVAVDASAHARQKLIPLLSARGLAYDVAFLRRELGAAVGLGPLSAVSVSDDRLANRLRDLVRTGLADAGGLTPKPEGSDRGERDET
jgi:ribosomal protein L7Ae-like RNA K-turn-binding protein